MKELSANCIIERRGCHSAKWELAKKYSEDIIPMSVADMDIPSPRELIEYLGKLNKKGIYGYTIFPNNYKKIIQKYFLRHYGSYIDEESIVFCPRIIQAVSIYIREFTCINDNISILSPSYKPLVNAISLNKRNAILCDLIYKNNQYYINFDLLEDCFKKSKVFIFISPHNPTGTVWSKNDLEKIAMLAEKYGVFIISDDIHADFNFSNNKHIFISSISEYVENNSIICTSPSKTFNIPGLEISNLLIKNTCIRNKFKHHLEALGFHNPNYFSASALIITYSNCDEWRKELLEYIRENRSLVKDFFEKEIPELEVVNSQGTYLVWINYKKLNLNEDKLKYWLINLSKIEMSWGSDFLRGGEYFFRMNIAMPRIVLISCLRKIKEGLILLLEESHYGK